MAELEEAGWSKTQEKPKEELTNKVLFWMNIEKYKGIYRKRINSIN